MGTNANYSLSLLPNGNIAFIDKENADNFFIVTDNDFLIIKSVVRTMFNLDTKEKIDEFCADAGLVSVFLLDEVLKYNPDYDWHITKQYTATVIKDFKGTVKFVVKYQDGYYENETEYHRKGEHWEEYYLEVIGHGINKVTDKPINFVGKQGSF